MLPKGEPRPPACVLQREHNSYFRNNCSAVEHFNSVRPLYGTSPT